MHAGKSFRPPLLQSVICKGRTIRYLRGGGGVGKHQKKIRAQKKSRKKISCTTKVILKKISCKGMLQKKKFLQAIGG